MKKSWELNTAACDVSAALSPSLAAGIVPVEDISTLRLALAKCFILDKALSTSMGRKALFSCLNIDLRMITPTSEEKPSDVMLGVLLELAEIQDLVLDYQQERSLIATQDSRPDSYKHLHQRITHLNSRVQKVRGVSCVPADSKSLCFDKIIHKHQDLIGNAVTDAATAP